MFDIPAAITATTNMISGIVDRIWPDPNESEKNAIERLKVMVAQEMASLKGQLDANIVAAKHGSVFVAGARPFILWVCGGALAYSTLIEPIMRFVAQVCFGYIGDFPVLNTEIVNTALFGLLGLGGYRTFEKVKGVSRETLKK